MKYTLALLILIASPAFADEPTPIEQFICDWTGFMCDEIRGNNIPPPAPPSPRLAAAAIAAVC